MGKKRLNALSVIANDSNYSSLSEVFAAVKSSAHASFDENIDIAIGLNLGAKSQGIRGVFYPPSGTGKKCIVAVFADGEKANEAKAAGADFVGGVDLVEKIISTGVFFDCCIATPDIVSSLSKAARILGPRGLMPSASTETVTSDVANAVKKAKSGRITYKSDKAGFVYAGIGKVSFSVESLISNFDGFVKSIVQSKPSSVKGSFVKKVYISSTMGVGFPINLGML